MLGQHIAGNDKLITVEEAGWTGGIEERFKQGCTQSR